MKLFYLFILFILSASSAWAENRPQGDGKIRLFNYHLQEFLEVEFKKDGVLIPEAFDQIKNLLRSRDSGKVQDIDPKLLDLIDHLQDHFGAETVEIISGFRSPEFNQKLLAEGHKVSPQSLHTQGIAMDIHLDEIREPTLVAYARSLAAGGVGNYDPLDFVHIDLGPVRYWEEKSTGRKLIGVLDPQSPIQLNSDKNEYLIYESITFIFNIQGTVKNNEIEKIKLEHFARGAWQVCSNTTDISTAAKSQTFAAKALSCTLLGDQHYSYGKFRWTFQRRGENTPLSSNEFYIKKE